MGRFWRFGSILVAGQAALLGGWGDGVNRVFWYFTQYSGGAVENVEPLAESAPERPVWRRSGAGYQKRLENFRPKMRGLIVYVRVESEHTSIAQKVLRDS